MFPVALDLTRIPVLLAGQGELVLKRLAYLDEAGATQVRVFSPAPSDLLKAAAGERLAPRLPDADELRDFRLILLGGLERSVAEPLVHAAHALGRLVNVEDVNDLCDFYFTANIRRGDLVIAVSTSGASPTLARKMRDYIAAKIGPEWSARVQELAQLRQKMKKEGASMRDIMDTTERHLVEKGWLPGNDKGEAA
jgi:precorrin-2 dehydrogenase / sirohydrochlorin ferrochelatase